MTQQFRLLVIAACLTRFELAFRSTIFMLFAVSIGSTVTQTAAIGFLSIAPTIFSATIVSGLVVRFGETHCLRASLIADVLLCLLTFVLLGCHSVILLFLCCLLFGIVRPLIDNCINSLVIDLASKRHLERSNGMLSTMQAISGAAAPALGGLLFGLGFDWSLVVMFTVAIVAVLFAAAIRHHALGIQSDLSSDNARIFLRDNRPLAVLVLVGMLSNVWAGVFNAQYPLLLLRVIGMPSRMYGINNTLLNGGLICASLLFFLVADKVDSWSYATAADLVRCGSLGMMIFFTEIPFQFGAAFMYGLAMGVWNSGSSSATLRLAKGPYQRQYLAKSRSAVFAGAPIGSLVGAFTGSLEIGHVMMILIVGWLVCWVVMLSYRRSFIEATSDS